MTEYVVHPEAELPYNEEIEKKAKKAPKSFLPRSESDWLRAVNVDWARGFSDIVEIGSSKYDFIRIWQNDPVRYPWHDDSKLALL